MAHVIGIEHDLICTELIYGHVVILKRLRNHVESNIDIVLFGIRRGSLVDENVVLRVVSSYPLKACPCMVIDPKLRMLDIELVELSIEVLKEPVRLVIEQEPLELLIETPLDELTELGAHEIELCTGVADLVEHH